MARIHRRNPGVILFPHRRSEADLACEIVSALSKSRPNLKPRQQVIAHVEVNGRLRRCQFDIVLFGENTHPLAIIEIKRTPSKKPRPDSSQVSKYRQFGLPVFVCKGWPQVPETISKIEEMFLLKTEKGE